jgi:hypothetical protein
LSRIAEQGARLILAIDPGTEQSGWCDFEDGRVTGSGVIPNADMLWAVQHQSVAVLAIEMVASYGMPVGREVFETVRWIGRFQQAWRQPDDVMLIYRRDVKLCLCGSMKAKDANVWQALIDKLGPVGTKKEPGPLYGVKSHARSAVAVAVTAQHQLLQGVL